MINLSIAPQKNRVYKLCSQPDSLPVLYLDRHEIDTLRLLASSSPSSPNIRTFVLIISYFKDKRERYDGQLRQLKLSLVRRRFISTLLRWQMESSCLS